MQAESLFGRRGSDHIALYDAKNDQALTFDQLTERTSLLSESLKEGKLRLAFCFSDNSIKSVLFYLGCLLAGLPIALFESKLLAERKLALFNIYEPDLVLCDAEDGPLLQNAGYTPGNIEGTDVWFKTRSAVDPSSDLALLLSTSGSTGSSRMVRLTLRNIEANTVSIIEALGITQQDVAITSLPIHYSYGLSVLNTHLYAGATVVLTEPAIMTGDFWKTFRQHKCTFLAGVPYTFELLDRLDLKRLNLPSLKKLTVAGGKLKPELAEKYHKLMSERGGEFFVMYGQTEATARIAILPPHMLPQELGSAGIAIPGGTLKIEEPDAKGYGEVIYEGTNVMLGYADSAQDLTLGDVNKGRLPTGDIGYLNEHGCLYVTGRLKRFAKIFGYRIDLDAIESLVRKYCYCGIVSDDNNIYIFTEKDCDIESIKEALEAEVNISRSVFLFRSLETIPHLSSGKMDYVQMRNYIDS